MFGNSSSGFLEKEWEMQFTAIIFYKFPLCNVLSDSILILCSFAAILRTTSCLRVQHSFISTWLMPRCILIHYLFVFQLLMKETVLYQEMHRGMLHCGIWGVTIRVNDLAHSENSPDKTGNVIFKFYDFLQLLSYFLLCTTDQFCFNLCEILKF